MKYSKQKLLIEQLDRKLEPFRELEFVSVPSKGWLHNVRTTLNMSLRQLGKRLDISPQSAKETEEREANSSITIKSLREAVWL
jgi:hypothetical protein